MNIDLFLVNEILHNHNNYWATNLCKAYSILWPNPYKISEKELLTNHNLLRK